MTVEELIKELLKYDPQLEVMYEDNENGETDIVEVKIEEHTDWSKYPARNMIQYISLR